MALRDSDRRARRRPTDRRASTRRPAAGASRSWRTACPARRTSATGSRSRVRVIRSSTKGSSPSKTRISTAGRRRRATRSCSGSTRGTPELAKLLNLLVLEPDMPGIETGRTDIAGIFIPDVIKVDLSTESARLAGGGPMHPTNPDDRRLLTSQHLRRRRAGEPDPAGLRQAA